MAAATHFTFPPQYDELPIGFRFRPTEDELITHYLEHKMLGGHESLVQYILEIDLYKYEPWELPQRSIFESDNFEWFFFRAHTSKTKRTTGTGCWRTTGDDRPIKARGTNKVIATRKILVFYEGRGANAVKTNWVIHEYHHPHLDTNISYQHPFVICRLKENAEERDVSTCERNEQNSGVASHLKKKGTQRAIQEMNRDAQANGPSVLQPLWYPTRQTALADVQSVNNAYDGEVNMQLIQRGAFEYEVNTREFLDVMFDPAEFLNDEAKLPWCSNPEPALMDFQPSNGNDGEVQNQLLQPKASESELNLSGFLFNSLLVEDENWDEETSNDLIDSYNQEELDSMLYELPYVGFSSDTDTDTAFGLPNNHISPSLYQYTRSPGHNMPTINKSLRSPLTVKRFEHKEEKDIYGVDELRLRGNSSVQGEARICRTSMDSDKSDPGPRTFKVQRQPKSSSSNVVPYGSEPKRDRLKREIRSKAMSQDKAKEDEKHMEIVDSPQRQLSMTDSNNGLKSEAGNKATPTKSGMSCCGCGYIGSRRRNWFSYILTTKRIHHESSLPVVYVAKAILGTVMFVMFAQKVLLYGHWR